MRITWLADELRARDVAVREWAEWQAFGAHELEDDLWGIVVHHTASRRGRDGELEAGALRRSSGPPANVPPPRAHLLVARDGVVHVLSAMKANHAGVGSWPGVRETGQLVGIEIDNDGIGEHYPAVQATAVLETCAAICARMGWPASRAISHAEWAPTRKIDPRGPVVGRAWGGHTAARPWSMDLFRADLAAALKPAPAPVPPDEPEADVLWIATRKREAAGDENVGHWVTDGITRRKLKDSDDEALMVAGFGARRVQPGNGPLQIPGATWDAIPVVER